MTEKIKIYIPVCDKYLNCLPILKYTMEKYWDKNLDVTVLGYTKPQFDLGWNFFQLGDNIGSEYFNPPGFSHEVYKFFSKIDDKFFIYLDPDGPIIRNINKELLEILHNCMIEDDKVCRVELTKDLQLKDTVFINEDGTKSYGATGSG